MNALPRALPKRPPDDGTFILAPVSLARLRFGRRVAFARTTGRFALDRADPLVRAAIALSDPAFQESAIVPWPRRAE